MSSKRLAFTSSQAASYLGVSKVTVQRWAAEGKMPGYRTPGGQWRFSREELDAWLASLDGHREALERNIGALRP